MPAKRIISTCLSLSITSTALAQSFATLDIDTKRMPFPTESGVSSSCAVGDFDGNLIVDSVHLRGGMLTFIHDVGYDGVAVELPFTASDIVTLEDGAGKHDTWLVVGSMGLFMGCWSDDAFEASGVSTSGIVMTAIETVQWRGATRVVTGDIDGDGVRDIVGASPALGLVLTMLGSEYGFTNGPSIPCATGPYAIGTFDRNQDGRDQIVISMQNGPHVFDLIAGGPVESACWLPKHVYIQFAPYRNNDGSQSLVGLTRSSTNGQFVALDRDGSVNSLLSLGSATDATGVAVADFDLDGRVDLAINSRASANHLWSIAQPTSPTFDLQGDLINFYLAPADGQGGVDPTRETRCVAVDLDNDFDQDLLWGDDITMTSTALINPVLDANAFKPQLLHFSSPNFETESGNLEIGFDILPPLALLPGLTHYELTVWRQASSTAAADSVAVAYAVEPIDSLSSFTVVSLELPEIGVEFETIYWLRLRAVGLASTIVPQTIPLSAAGPCSSFRIDLSPSLIEHFDPKKTHNGVPILSGGSIPQPPPGHVVFPNGPPTSGPSTGSSGGGG